MAVLVRPKVKNLQLRSGEVVGPESEVSLQTDEAWALYIKGLVDIVCERGKQIELAVKKPEESR